jgi:transcriptional regulator with XRE-family HTH domain
MSKRETKRKPVPEDVDLGHKIKIRRIEQKLSQAELGAQLGGLSFQQIQKYERGVNRVGATRLSQIAKALDVPVTFFYDDDGKGSREVRSLLTETKGDLSVRLLRAYSQITQPGLRRQIVGLVESICHQAAA